MDKMSAVTETLSETDIHTEESSLVPTKRVVLLDLDTFRAHLEQLARDSGGRAELGRRLSVSPSCIDSLISGARKPGPKVLKAIGARRKVMIEIDVEGE